MLRRRRHGGSEELTTTDDREEGQELDHSSESASAGAAQNAPANGGHGPWDSTGEYPHAERIDFGSILVPVHEGFDIQLNLAEEHGVWVAVVREESGMQLQAFAAPKNAGLWDEVRHEIAANIAEAGGSCWEADGPVGRDLFAEVPVAAAEDQPPELQPVRFLGADGPRWFLRAVISGPAARSSDLAGPFEALFADVVVVRGDYPAPPKEQLEIRLPEEARQGLEAQFNEQNPGWDLPNPFERGPEITETR